METLLTDNRLDQPIWLLLSLLLVIACYFRFDRLWSTRNLDLALLLLLAPGLLFLEAHPRYGHLWFLTGSVAILARLLVDSYLKRRPRFPQNLNLAGLSFLAATCCLFQMAYLYTFDRQTNSALADSESEQSLPAALGTEPEYNKSQEATGVFTGFATPPISALEDGAVESPAAEPRSHTIRLLTALSHVLIAAGLLAMGWQHFGDLSLGVSMAALYLLLPYTAYFASDLSQILPAVFLLGAILRFPHPVQTGCLIGLASAIFVFPVFLIPVWVSFYGLKTSLRFSLGLFLASVAVLAANTLISGHWLPVQFFDTSMLNFSGEGDAGVWAGVQSIWRLPIFVLFLVAVGVLCWWPSEKTLEILLVRLTILLIGIQFWNIQGGGTFPLWYVPFFLLIAFRPSLSHLAPPDTVGWLRRSSRQNRSYLATPHGLPTGSEPLRAVFR